MTVSVIPMATTIMGLISRVMNASHCANSVAHTNNFSVLFAKMKTP